MTGAMGDVGEATHFALSLRFSLSLSFFLSFSKNR